MNKQELINSLQSSDLFAECSKCGEGFKLSDAVLFDGKGAFPDPAKKRQKELLEELNSQMEALTKRKLSADKRSETQAIATGFGQVIEKIIPAHKNFKIPVPDCRPLFMPVDLIVFNGLNEMDVKSVTFLEIKTGDARLVPRERMIKKAVEDKKVDYRVV